MAAQKKKKPDMNAVAVSPFTLSTPRGRRRVSLLIILGGLAVSHLYQSDVFSDIVNSTPTNVPVQAPWTP